MLIKKTPKGRHYLSLAFALLAAALIAGFLFEKNFAGWFRIAVIGKCFAAKREF